MQITIPSTPDSLGDAESPSSPKNSPTGSGKRKKELIRSASVIHEGSITLDTNGSDANGPAKRFSGDFSLAPNRNNSSKALVSDSNGRRGGWKWYFLVIVESKPFVSLMMLLTIYALIGEDTKLMTTDKNADTIFMVLTCVCMGLFTMEIIMSSLAKEDYYMSFFFWLDIISTLSLILDIPEVNDMMLGSDEELQNMRGSRTARIGARLGRIVRVLRLVRILKLYKAVFEQVQAKRRRDKRLKKRRPGEEEDWADMELTTQEHRESRVGIRLSELTIRRVIFLILFMMLLLPLLRVDPAMQFASSAQYGADLVYSTFTRLQKEGTTAARQAYDKALLKYLYYHSWFTMESSSCPFDRQCAKHYTSGVFWFGIASAVDFPDATLEDMIDIGKLNGTTIESWEYEQIELVQASEDSAYRYNYGRMPEVQKEKMGARWNEDCPYRGARPMYRMGLSFLDTEVDDFNGAKVNFVAKCPEDLRRVERRKVAPMLQITKEQYQDWHFAFYFDLRPYVREEAMFSMLTTGFVLLSLMVASLQFAADANVLVLYPVENMMHKVETISGNPLLATKVADEEWKMEQIKKARRVKTRNQWSFRYVSDKLSCMQSESNTEVMETVVLEKTIIKLGSLLALGFGEAGSHIIESNMSGGHTASVNAMVEGTRVDCILGNVRIRDFGFATEVLQGKVMTFVNQIAEIVHGVVNEFHGAANKNNGDTYLVVWTVSDSEFEVKQRFADMSVVAFARILAAVHRSPLLATYREHPGLQQRLGERCRVNVTSGLHFGWAIEGAVGSEFKIDASYLSPNVSLSEGIERATEIYNVNILVSEAVKNMCTPGIAAALRLIDRVIMTGSPDPFDLYVLDLDIRGLAVEKQPDKRWHWSSRVRFRVRQYLEAEKSKMMEEDFNLVELFKTDEDIATMRFRYTLEFTQIFNMGYQNYSQGEWQVAQRLLQRSHDMLGVTDGPSQALLTFMGNAPTPYSAPEKWSGIRELQEAELA